MHPPNTPNPGTLAMPSFLAAAPVPAYSSRARSLPTNILPDRRRRSAITGIVLRKKTEIDIVIEDQQFDFVNVYSTHDEIKGNVELKFDRDTLVDELIITFEGQSATYVEKIASTAPTTGRTTGKHTFLKLLQPVDSDDLPEGNLFKAGQVHRVAFVFRVPPTLLPYVCSHSVENEATRKPHLELPPSMGDPSIAGDGHQLMDDVAPAMARVSYGIRARATTRLASGKIVDAAERIERVLIRPARDEEPPVHIDEDSWYMMRREKGVKKGLFKLGKVGRITAEATQPKSFRLPHPQKRTAEPVSTNTSINLRFDPLSEEDQPPALGSILSKLRVYTFFGAAPYRIIPEIHRCDNWSTLHGVYSEAVELSQRCLSTVTWSKHDAGTSPVSRTASYNSDDFARRPSTFSTASSASIPEPSAAWNPDLPFYTASVLVPLSLPTSQGNNKPKIFLPTFHSCIISRSYTLEMTLSYSSPGTTVSTPNLTLKVPVQISAEGGTPPSPQHLTASDAAAADEAALMAEIERQFGLDLGLGLESPNYDEVAPLLHAQRHMSIAVSNPVSGARNASQQQQAPPEYAAGGGYGRQTSGARAGMVGGVRTIGVSPLAAGAARLWSLSS
jgi:hypothetical protein